MNLCNRPVYVKSEKSDKKPTAAEKRHMDKVVKLPCIVGPDECNYAPYYRSTLHHCGTGAGGRKNHKKVLPLCCRHHTGDLGINGGLSRREWEVRYGTEEQLLKKLETL
jgi:hypothetical protein